MILCNITKLETDKSCGQPAIAFIKNSKHRLGGLVYVCLFCKEDHEKMHDSNSYTVCSLIFVDLPVYRFELIEME